MRSFLGVGGVDYGRDVQDHHGSSGNLIASATRGAGLYGAKVAELPPLPGSEDEVRAISSAFSGARTLIGVAATKTAFEAQPLERYRVLHLAVHGVADPKEPDHAALILRDDPTSHQDGYLEPAEVARLHLNADLVTLSASAISSGEPGAVSLACASASGMAG